MWYHAYQTVFRSVERMNFQQYALFVLVVVALGFWCMRGFGSRHNY